MLTTLKRQVKDPAENEARQQVLSMYQELPRFSQDLLIKYWYPTPHPLEALHSILVDFGLNVDCVGCGLILFGFGSNQQAASTQAASIRQQAAGNRHQASGIRHQAASNKYQPNNNHVNQWKDAGDPCPVAEGQKLHLGQ